MKITQRQKVLTQGAIRRIAEVTIRERKMLCTVDEYLAECQRRSNGEKPQLDENGRKVQ